MDGIVYTGPILRKHCFGKFVRAADTKEEKASYSTATTSLAGRKRVGGWCCYGLLNGLDDYLRVWV